MQKTLVCEEYDFCKHLHIDFRKAFIGVGSPKLYSFCSAVIKIAIFEWQTSIRFGIFEMENFDEKNVVKKSSNPFDVFKSKSIILIAAEASALSIFAFGMQKTLVCEEYDFCKHLHIDFRKAFIGVGSPKLYSFCSAVIKIAIFEWQTSIRFGIFEMENFDEKNVVKKSSNPFDVFQSKSIILIAAEASTLSIFAFQM